MVLGGIVVSTDDNAVRQQLRDFDEPMCYFGEGPLERRERLRGLFAKHGIDALKKRKRPDDEEFDDEDGEQEPKETWYHEGSEDLKRCRYALAEYSIRQCKQRLDTARVRQLEDADTRHMPRQDLIKFLRAFEDSGSQVGDKRPLSSCNISPDNSLIATSSFSGKCHLWNSSDQSLKLTLRGHNDCKANYIGFHPFSTTNKLSTSNLNMASCGRDGNVFLWSLDQSEPIGNFEHDEVNVSRLRFHPCGQYMATCCSDKSWRLWDLLQNSELLHQEGHTDAVYDLAFHPDGSLAVSGGLDSHGRVWDLRTGRCITTLIGHSLGILSVDCSPNGYHLATGSQDNTVKIWDLRRNKCVSTIPAHTNNVVKVQFEKIAGNYLATASTDNIVKLWSMPVWTPIHTLTGHDQQVTGMDCAHDSRFIVTCSTDRTFKIWKAFNLPMLSNDISTPMVM